MAERLLLNLFLSMTPVVAYQLIMFTGLYDRNSSKTKVIIGTLCGLSSIACMRFPIVTGTHFLWDLRWIPFLIAVVYSGRRGFAICAVLIILFRASLCGFLAWEIVAVDAIILFVGIKIYPRLRPRKQQGLRDTIWTSMALSAISYFFILASISLYFYLSHNEKFFLQQGSLFYAVYGVVTVLAYTVSALLIENLFKQMEIRNELQQAEKLRLLADMAASFAHEIRNPLTTAVGFIQLTAESLTDEKSKQRMELTLSDLRNSEYITLAYIQLTKRTSEENQGLL